MSEAEEFCRWCPENEILNDLHFHSIVDDYKGLVLSLHHWEGDQGFLVKIEFEVALAYRNVNESFRLQTWSSNAWPGGKWSVYEVHRSRFISWLRNEGAGMLANCEPRHFAIYTGEDCIDVIAEEEPTITSHKIRAS